MRIAVIAVVGYVLAACGGGGAPIDAARPSLAPSPVGAAASPTAPAPAGTPVSAGAVPEAGVLYVWGADDGIYRYDGATGALTRVAGASTIALESAAGPYVLGRHGGISLLRWDGTTAVACPSGSYAAISGRGACAYRDDTNALYVDAGDGPRKLLPSDWGAAQVVWSPDGAELAVIRTQLRPEPVRAHQTLWLLDRHGGLTKLFDSPAATSFLYGVQWSTDRRLSFWESATTSASFAADGVANSLHIVNVDTLATVDLGTTLGARAWAQWSNDGRLAFVAGGDRTTWHMKQVKVVLPDGSVLTAAGDGALHPGPTSTSAIAPAWSPVGAPQLAWIEGPAAGMEASPEYFRETGSSAGRVAMLGQDTRLGCPGLVTEGVRWSADATSVLLLCRVPAVEHHALQLWYAPLGGPPRALVTGLGDLGFGFYGLQPSLFEMVSWSLASR
ncbi:MAG TPA: hypothetical protein VGA38_11365 [Candidatus Limnocylindria bacterium]